MLCHWRGIVTDRLALGVIPGAGWSAGEIQAVAREAEEAGFDAILAAEVNNDVLGTAQLMGTATQKILVGTWVANIYLRHPYVVAQGAALISEVTGGRMILGLGVSHQPVNGALGVDMMNPPAALRQYVTEVRGWLRGEGPATHLPQKPADPPVPVYVSALTSNIVEMASELADGIMPLFWSADRTERSKTWIDRGRAKATDLGPLDLALGIPTFVGDDLASMREAARQNLALFTTFPFFQRLFRASGFAEEADQMEQGAGAPSLTDRVLDAICLIGPIERCQERLDAFRAAGVTFPILMAPIGVEGARSVIRAFRR
jgi:alkanesulfonate monooxygenase SsuD/methylene tetrahydromethanopterin reductase-like flavin-dependent oxidoreductase (luciferase family)